MALRVIILCFCLFLFAGQSAALTYYDIGFPSLTEVWVDPVNGDDANSGEGLVTAKITITAAWELVPENSTLAATGYRINLLPGSYHCEPGPEVENCVNYFADRLGTFQFPVIIRAYNGPGTAFIRGGMDINNVRYLYLLDLDLLGGTPLPTNISGNNLLHLAGSDHVLLRGLTLKGPSCDNDLCNNLQEVLKVNQTQYLYVEDSAIGGAWHTSVDYMVVQYGHFFNNRLHTAGQWCMYLKGGSSYLRIEGNELHGCQLGFEAGQAANFAVMVSPWFHYDAYDIRFVNNLLHDIPGVGLSVAGGYNILFAYNTLYRVATDERGYGLIDFVHGERNCTPTDELPAFVAQCNAYINLGGWGPNVETESVAVVPNRNIYVYNNIFYNPAPLQTQWSHFEVRGPVIPPSDFVNFPSPSRADDNLVIRGNVIWNGQVDHPLGIEESDQGCQGSNPTCNETQLRTDNSINTIEPQLADPGNGDFHPVSGSNLFSAASYTVPDFVWTDAPSPPTVPTGGLSNSIAEDREGTGRSTPGPAGAYNQTMGSCAVGKVRNAASGAYYTDIQDPYSTTLDGQALRLHLQIREFTGSPIFAKDIRLTLIGGYDCTYRSNPGMSTIGESLTISSGTVTLDRILIN
ncbi:MAG: right-handed parallel beta-helix repeat-containing protein [Nitrospirae bacterium]|nr:right-handed parallel beta-helix repeat-containing protein [Nitrospirota bacterium]